MHQIIVQRAVKNVFIPSTKQLRRVAKKVLQTQTKIKSAEITLRIVDKKEMTELNLTYRHKKGPTNVLSFPAMMIDDTNMRVPILGDIVICADVVNEEAKTQGKSQKAHWSHMIVHGILHLLGYNHEEKNEADVMETLEIKILNQLGFKNPYE